MMNQVIENIAKRRSVRSYEPNPVPKDVLTAIIEAGNAAPSGFNAQGWRFVLIQDVEFRRKLAGLALPRYKKWFENAPEEIKERRRKVDAFTDDPQIRKEFELKPEEKVYGPILLGYPKGDFPEPPPKNPPAIKWI